MTFGRYATIGMLTVGLLVLALGFAAGANATATNAKHHKSGGSTSSGTWNISANAPTWNSGNLCNTTATNNNSTIWCVYNGNTASGHGGWGRWGGVNSNCGGGCTPTLSYNFSGKGETYYILISNLSRSLNNIVLNLHGDHDTIYFNISGCQGAKVNFTLFGQELTLNVNYSVSRTTSNFYFYPDNDVFNAVYWGSDDVSATWFAGVGVKQNLCPYENTSRLDSGTATSAGYWNVQYFVYANAVNYTSALHYTNMTGGWHNYVGWENVTSMWCGWSVAPPCSTGHSWWGTNQGARRAE
jgi:hypothetical protein